MSHPFNGKRANIVERARVPSLTQGYADTGGADHHVKHYAKGGAVHSDEAQDKKLVKKMLKEEEKKEKASGGSVSFRADRFARGGKVKGKKGNTTVNVVVGHHGMPAGGPPPMAAVPTAPPRPMAPPIPPAGGPPMAAPPGGAPMPPPGIRASGGRVKATQRASGGAIPTGSGDAKATSGGLNGVYPTPGKGTSVFQSGVKNGTPVSHAESKDDQKAVGRDKVVTYARGGKVRRDDGGSVPDDIKPFGPTNDVKIDSRGKVKGLKTGGAVEHAVKGQMAPHLPGGSGGGEARLVKAHKLHKAAKGTFSNATGK